MSAGGNGHILLVEDEPRLAAVLKEYLVASGYTCRWVDDGNQAMRAFNEERPHLVLLDLMLPGRNGMEICRDLRRESQVPVIMVTARADEVDRLLGLEIGADDYICKPFSPREVVARIGAVLRRHRHDPRAAVVSLLSIDEAACRASIGGRDLELTPVEFRLLRTLAAAPGRVWSRDQLMNHLYADHRIVTDRTVDSHVKNLRRKLSEAGAEDDPIRSIYGVGYRLDL